MFIFQIDITKLVGGENSKGISEAVKNPDSVLFKSLSQASEIDPVISLPPPDNLLKTIQELSKALLEDPYNNLIEIPKLGKALAKYTHTEYDLGKADKLFSFFLGDKSDLTGDGQIDYQDVIKFWKDLDHSDQPPFPMYVNIDLDKDGTNDYSIRNGKIFKFIPSPPGTLIASREIEVDSIPGVDLKSLSDEIKQKFEECKQDPAHQGEKPFPCVSVQFDDDINGDGKIDHITADTGIRTPVPLTREKQINQRPLELDNVSQLQATSGDMLRPHSSLKLALRKVIDSIIKNGGDFSKVDEEIFSKLANTLAEKTGIPVDENRKVLLQQFFQYKAFPPRGMPGPKPPLNVEGLKNLKSDDVIKFWKDPKLDIHLIA